MAETVVEIAGLGAKVAGSRQVVDAHVEAERLQLLAATAGGNRFLDPVGIALLVGAAVIEKSDGEVVGGVVDRLGGGERRGERPGVLVVGGDEDVDGWQVARRRRRSAARQRPGRPRKGSETA